MATALPAARGLAQRGAAPDFAGVAWINTPARGPAPGEYQLDGTWQRDGEALALRSARGGVRVNFSAAKFHLVAAAPEAGTLRVAVDGTPAASVAVGPPTLYTLVDGTAYGEHVLAIQADMPGLSLFSAAFG